MNTVIFWERGYIMDWHYLDKMHKNLLYVYADCLSSKKDKMIVCSKADTDADDEEKAMRIYFIIWFVFRYCMNCRTLEEAMSCDKQTVLEKYRLKPFFTGRNLYIGTIEHRVTIYEPDDVNLIIEILYKRLNAIEQLKCYLKHLKNKPLKSRSAFIAEKHIRYLSAEVARLRNENI